MICLDNSDWMRNGDYIPTRLSAQQDAASLICTQRTDSHPESTVGLLTMAGKGVEVLVSPTENIGKILACFAEIKSEGAPEISTAVSIAQLALRHRKNKHGEQRIIIFVGSPVKSGEKELKKLGSQLKKNNIAVDVVVMGEHDEVQDKMTELVNAANTNDNSHLIVVPPGVQPSDALISSPIFQGSGSVGNSVGGGEVGGMGGGGDLFAEYGGVDPSLDPELAMVMRASAEEARQREEARLLEATKLSTEESKGNEENKSNEESKEEKSSTSNEENKQQSSTPTQTTEINEGGDELEEDEEALLQAALAISLQDTAATQDGVKNETDGLKQQEEEEEEYEDDMDEEMRLALAMSMEEELNSAANNNTLTSTTEENSTPAVLLDTDFVSQLLGSVDVDKDDPLIQAALQQMSSGSGNNDGEEKEKADDNNSSGSRKRKEDDR